MGQVAYGILYGIITPDGVNIYKENSDCARTGGEYLTGLVPDFERACHDKIAALAARRAKEPWSVEGCYLPDHGYSDDLREGYAGFWIAVGPNGYGPLREHGECSLNLAPVPLGAIRTTEPYASAYKAARRRWRRFARWAGTQGVVLPEPRLWLMDTEVA